MAKLASGRSARWAWMDQSGFQSADAWVWTPFNRHIHNDEFHAALAARTSDRTAPPAPVQAEQEDTDG